MTRLLFFNPAIAYINFAENNNRYSIFDNLNIEPGYAAFFHSGALTENVLFAENELERNGFTVQRWLPHSDELNDTIVIRRINLPNIDEKAFIYLKWNTGVDDATIHDFCDAALDILDMRKGHLHFVREEEPRLRAKFRRGLGLLNRSYYSLTDDDDDEDNQVSEADREDEIALQIASKSSKDILDIIRNLIKTYVLKEHSFAPIEALLEATKSKMVISYITPSAIWVNNKLEVTLPEFDNMKFGFSPKMRVVYALFLRHPEGIFLGSLETYRHEVIDLVKIVAPQGRYGLDANSAIVLSENNSADMNQMISKINRIVKNQIHPMSGIDMFYRITGERGEKYKILMANQATFK